MGAHAVLNTNSKEQVTKAARSFDFILSTINAPIDLNPYMDALAPRGRFHTVGLMPEVRVGIMPLVLKQTSVSGSPSGAPATVATMFDFCGRHGIEPVTEEFPMTKVNEALAHLEAGKARYRIVLKNDLQ